MRIAVIGINHVTANISIRERLSFTDSQKIEILNQLLDNQVEECIVLSTCNRSEIYICTSYIEKGITHVQCVYEMYGQLKDIERYLFVKVDEAAIEHLFKVTAGLKSMVIGEDQILGQVRDAHELALEVGSSGKILNKCFREAVTVAKSIKSEIGISEYPTSISYIGIQLLKQEIGSIKGKKILLIGAGKMSRLALNYLYEEEVEQVYIANRTSQTGYTLKDQYTDLKVIPFEKRYEKLQEVDIVVASTASPHLVIERDKVQISQRIIYMLDLAMPRDIDQTLRGLSQVKLYDIDDLKAIAAENLECRKKLAEVAEVFIQTGVDKVLIWLQTIKSDSTIESLHRRCDTIQQDTMHYIKRKIALSYKEEKIIEKMIKSSLKRLIREPVSNLKDIKDADKQEAYIQLIGELFEL